MNAFSPPLAHWSVDQDQRTTAVFPHRVTIRDRNPMGIDDCPVPPVHYQSPGPVPKLHLLTMELSIVVHHPQHLSRPSYRLPPHTIERSRTAGTPKHHRRSDRNRDRDIKPVQGTKLRSRSNFLSVWSAELLSIKSKPSQRTRSGAPNSSNILEQPRWLRKTD